MDDHDRTIQHDQCAIFAENMMADIDEDIREHMCRQLAHRMQLAKRHLPDKRKMSEESREVLHKFYDAVYGHGAHDAYHEMEGEVGKADSLAVGLIETLERIHSALSTGGLGVGEVLLITQAKLDEMARLKEDIRIQRISIGYDVPPELLNELTPIEQLDTAKIRAIADRAGPRLIMFAALGEDFLKLSNGAGEVLVEALARAKERSPEGFELTEGIMQEYGKMVIGKARAAARKDAVPEPVIAIDDTVMAILQTIQKKPRE